MITLHQFAAVPWLPNPSPFCMKVENYLRMAAVPFEPNYKASPIKAPKKKLPFITDDAKTIADSGFIIEYLKKTYGDPLDAAVSAPDRAMATALVRLMEEHLYWSLVYSRWSDDASWPQTRTVFFAELPAPLRAIVPSLARKGIRESLAGHGMGRHSRDEIYALGRADLDVLSEFLGEKDFFLGKKPTTLDATAYAFIANVLVAPFETPLKEHAATLSNLAPYCARMKAKYYA
jgi:glutathione S-transferase